MFVLSLFNLALAAKMANTCVLGSKAITNPLLPVAKAMGTVRSPVFAPISITRLSFRIILLKKSTSSCVICLGCNKGFSQLA